MSELVDAITVRATVNLPDLKCGETAIVNPATPYVKMCLEHKLIVPVHGSYVSPTA